MHPLLQELDVSRETSDRLTAYVKLIEKWNPAINLIAKSTLPEIWQRHIADSAQLFALAPKDATRWLDLGSGAGLPAIVLATLAREQRPAARFILVESDRRKATFLQTVCRELNLPAKVLCERIELLPPQQADLITARALAPLDKLCGLALPHLADGATCLFPKGAGHVEEIAQARKNWQMKMTSHPSATDPAAVILQLKDLAHV